MVIAKVLVTRGAMLALLVAGVSFLSKPAAADDAAATYKTKCAMCHGADGKGDTPAGKKMGAHDFGSAEVQKMSDADLTQAIAKAKTKCRRIPESLRTLRSRRWLNMTGSLA